MKNNKVSSYRRQAASFIILFFIAIFLSSCAGQDTEQGFFKSSSDVSSYVHSEKPLSKVKKILLIPLSEYKDKLHKEAAVECPLTKEVFLTGTVSKTSQEFLTNALFARIDGVEGIVVMKGYKKDVSVKNAYDEAKKGGYDAVLTGFIYRYEDRVGASWSAVKPASVGYSIILVSGTTGEVLWKLTYKETQQALSGELQSAGTFIKRGVKWKSADELAIYGLNEGTKKLLKILAK